MNVQAWKCVVVSLAVVSLAACGTLQEHDFSPNGQGTKTQARNDRAGACLIELDRHVSPPPRTPLAGEVQVGYENHFERGADPFPCNHRDNYDHQAVVFFRTPVIPPGEVFLTATLQADLELIFLMPEIFTGRDCRMRFQTPTGTWSTGDFLGAAGDPRAHVPSTDKAQWARVSTGPQRLEQNVTAIVKGWLDGSIPNHGFSFAAPPEHSYAEENLSCVFAVHNWNLHVQTILPDPPSP